jgi:hypothetical protein
MTTKGLLNCGIANTGGETSADLSAWKAASSVEVSGWCHEFLPVRTVKGRAVSL